MHNAKKNANYSTHVKSPKYVLKKSHFTKLTAILYDMEMHNVNLLKSYAFRQRNCFSKWFKICDCFTNVNIVDVMDLLIVQNK